MSDIFVSYARPDENMAGQVVAALKGTGHSVWCDDLLPVYRAYAEVIEERLRLAKAVIVLWSAAASASQWVRSEANRARECNKLVQITLDGALPPMPFDQVQCADLRRWSGDTKAPAWGKVMRSIATLVGRQDAAATDQAADAALDEAEHIQAPLPQRLAASPTPPLVGREAEIASLAVAWASAQSGHGRIVLIGGDPASARPGWPQAWQPKRIRLAQPFYSGIATRTCWRPIARSLRRCISTPIILRMLPFAGISADAVRDCCVFFPNFASGWEPR